MAVEKIFADKINPKCKFDITRLCLYRYLNMGGMFLDLNKKLDGWLEKRNYRIGDILFLFLLIAAYIASIVMMETMDVATFFSSFLAAAASVYAAIWIIGNMDKNKQIGEN